MSLRKSLAVALTGLALASSPVLSAALVEQGPDFAGGEGLQSSLGAGVQNADNFSLAGASSITDITWWGSYDGTDTDDFAIRLLSDSGGAPGGIQVSFTSASVFRTDTQNLDAYGALIFQYDFQLPTAVSLSAGTYYLSIMNETTNAEWFWLFGTSGNGGQWNRAADDETWTSAAHEMSFRIAGTLTPVDVSEPSVLWLIGAAVFAGAARRKNWAAP